MLNILSHVKTLTKDNKKVYSVGNVYCLILDT